jgi:CTP-dependent riboflavin kinase
VAGLLDAIFAGLFQMMFSGVVSDGVGGASRDVTSGEYANDPFDFLPFPGTLNLEVESKVVADLGEPDWVKYFNGEELWFWFAHIEDDERVLVMWAKRCAIEDARFVELFAENGLREKYGLNNGDRVAVVR